MVARLLSSMFGQATTLPASGAPSVLDPVKRDSKGADTLPISSRKDAKSITQFLQKSLSLYGQSNVLMEGVVELKVANTIFLVTLESNSRMLRLVRKYDSRHFGKDELQHQAQSCNMNFRFVRTAFCLEPLTLFSDYEFFFDHERHPDQIHQVFRIFITVTNEIEKSLHYAA